ncbi:putative membrane protein YeiH [Okibacterium sp. HSC-33S16]|uniref:trimeric intracellular cation channel family protein n=1 Tax=Okibacterium sp. HSC-33S16 TaxID=2910965 RepID=UPI0020A21EE3|nr:trimeric intracellular cation channel family protein [Okibacterium sp. HSC-33S16]MCP2031138.1 putative membrane protein YeiH [Okibacterium sp. HSC-33S16]
MGFESPLLLTLDLLGTFAFGLNGALAAVRFARLDIVGVLTLGMLTAIGGGIIRDLILGATPPATFSDWRYLTVAAAGALIAFAFSQRLDRLAWPIEILDAVGLSVFAVTGATKALDFGLGPAQAVILGAITAVGGGTLRDTLIRRVPSVMSDGLYAIPALIGALIIVVAILLGVEGFVAAMIAAAVCFVIRVLGVRFNLNAPMPPGVRTDDSDRADD